MICLSPIFLSSLNHFIRELRNEIRQLLRHFVRRDVNRSVYKIDPIRIDALLTIQRMTHLVPLGARSDVDYCFGH